MISGKKYHRYKYEISPTGKYILGLDNFFYLYELLDEFPLITQQHADFYYDVHGFTVFVIDSLRKLHIRRSTIVSVLMQLEEFTP